MIDLRRRREWIWIVIFKRFKIWKWLDL